MNIYKLTAMCDDIFTSDFVTNVELTDWTSTFYSALSRSYYNQVPGTSFEYDEESSQYKLLEALINADYSISGNAQTLFYLLYAAKVEILDVKEFLSYLETNGFEMKNIILWFDEVDLLNRLNIAYEFFTYVGAHVYSTSDKTLIQFIRSIISSAPKVSSDSTTAHYNDRCRKSDASDRWNYALTPHYSRSPYRQTSGTVRNFREALSVYSNLMAQVVWNYPVMSWPIANIDTEIKTLHHSIVNVDMTKVPVFMKEPWALSQTEFDILSTILMENYYITINKHAGLAVFDDFVSYFINNMNQFTDPDTPNEHLTYANINFDHAKDYLKQYYNIIKSDISVTNISSIYGLLCILVEYFAMSELNEDLSDINTTYVYLHGYTQELISVIRGIAEDSEGQLTTTLNAY